MVFPSKTRSTKNGGASRRSARRPRLAGRSPNYYSHIKTLPAPVNNEDNNKEEKYSEGFIRKDSLHLQIQDQLIYHNKLSEAASQVNSSPPRTFAEATMSTRRAGSGHRNSLRDENGEASLSGPMSLESLGPFKYTFKKKKKVSKWMPLSLEYTGSGSEAGGLSDSASSRGVSPKLPPSTLSFVKPKQSSQEQQQQFHDPDLDSDNPFSLTTPRKSTGGYSDNELDAVHDTDPTPTQERFDLAVRDQPDTEEGEYPEIYHSDNSDTSSTRGRADAVMSQITRAMGARAGQDAFDSLDWDPDLPYATPDKSPEPIVATPKPVTYTTVGSRVDPDAVQQFTAPNRIQREGAGRRPLMSMMQNRNHYDYFQPRGTAPPLNMQNSMQYTQQLAQSPNSYNNYNFNSGTPPYSDHASQSAQGQTFQLNEQEQQVIANIRENAAGKSVHGLTGSTVESATPTITSGSTQLSHDSEPFIPNPRFRQQRGEDENGRQSNFNAPIQGLEKMQTLQRLANFDNPMQNLARSRLLEFSASKVQSSNNEPAPTNPMSALEMLLKNKSARSSTTAVNNTPAATPAPTTRGEMNFGYQFPPPGFTGPTTSQTNPLYSGYGGESSAPSASGYSQPQTSGYPQPLTAGPPGQRQLQGGLGRIGMSQVEQLWANDGRATTSDLTANTVPQPTSPWSPNHGRAPLVRPEHYLRSPGSRDYTIPHDTQPLEVVAQYYGAGFPGNMTGQYSSLSHYNQRLMGEIPDDPIPRNEEEKRAKNARDRESWFMDGQKRWGMTCTDHIIDREGLHQRQIQNPFGAIGPPPKLKKIDLTCTPEEFDKKTPTELATPLLGDAFGSLLAYADSTASSRKVLSNMTPSSPFLIDSSESGNDSFYGEDWGAPPKMLSRTGRYQGTFRNIRDTRWG